MNYPIIFRLLSIIIATEACAFLMSYAIGEIFFPSAQEISVRESWWFAIGIALALAIIFYYLGKKASPKIFRKEGLALIGIGWIVASLVGALPYYFCIVDCNFVDAIFESTSGLTTTGASVFTGLEQFPRSLIFWRCLSQWIGGLGVIVFFVALLSYLGAGAKILYSNESSGKSTDIESGKIQQGVRQIIGVYLVLSFMCTLVLYLCGMNGFDSLCHMFTTVSTGGFSTYSASVAEFQSPQIEWALIVFMALGGTSFFVLINAYRGKWKDVFNNTELYVYYSIIIIISLLLTSMLEWRMDSDNFLESFRICLFQTVSILTTTGFNTVDYQQWLPMAHTLLLVIIVIGGCSGSTAGGAKVVRCVVGIKVCINHSEKMFRSRVVRPLLMNNRVLDKEDQDNIVYFLVLLGFVCLSSLPIIALAENHLSFEGVLSAMCACIFNIGPGFAEVGPTVTYSFLAPFTKLFLSLLMIMGRLELYAIIVLFSPSLWRRFS